MFLNLQALPGEKNTFNITAVRSICFQNALLSADMLNMLNVFLECFRKCVSFWGNVEYVEYVLGPAKTYILRGTPQTYAIKNPSCDRQLDN